MSNLRDTSHLLWHLEFRLSRGSCGNSTQICVFSLSTSEHRGMICVPRDLILQLLLTSLLACHSWERPTALLFRRNMLAVWTAASFFYFGDASSSKKTKTFITRMSSTCCCCRVSAGDAFADWDTAKQTSWTLRRRPPKLKFSCSLNKQKRKGAKNLSQLYHHHYNVVVVFYVFAVHKKNLCFLLLTEVTKRNSRVQLSCFLSAVSCNWHCGRPLPARHRRVHRRICHVNCNHIYSSLHVDAACSWTGSQW